MVPPGRPGGPGGRVIGPGCLVFPCGYGPNLKPPLLVPGCLNRANHARLHGKLGCTWGCHPTKWGPLSGDNSAFKAGSWWGARMDQGFTSAVFLLDGKVCRVSSKMFLGACRVMPYVSFFNEPSAKSYNLMSYTNYFHAILKRVQGCFQNCP